MFRVPCHAVCGIGTLLCPADVTMQLIMWQRDIVGVGPFIVDLCHVLGALLDALTDGTNPSASALAGWKDVLQRTGSYHTFRLVNESQASNDGPLHHLFWKFFWSKI